MTMAEAVKINFPLTYQLSAAHRKWLAAGMFDRQHEHWHYWYRLGQEVRWHNIYNIFYYRCN